MCAANTNQLIEQQVVQQQNQLTNVTGIRNLFEDELKKLPILNIDFTKNASYEIIYKFLSEHPDEINKSFILLTKLEDLKLISRNILVNSLNKNKVELNEHSTILGNSRIKFLASINEYKWLKNKFDQIQTIIAPVVIEPANLPVVIELAVVQLVVVQPTVVQPAVVQPAVVQPDNLLTEFVISELNKQMTYINSIDDPVGKQPNYTHTNVIQTDMILLFELYNSCKNNFDNLLAEYKSAIIKYIKLLAYGKLYQRLILLRAEICPEEVENTL
jgi:hypothetical protein